MSDLRIRKKNLLPDVIDATKMLLENNTAIRFKKQDGSQMQAIKLSAEDKLVFAAALQCAVDPVAANDLVRKGHLDARLEQLIGAAPASLDTLQEIAEALSQDADAVASIITQLASKADLEDGYVVLSQIPDLAIAKITGLAEQLAALELQIAAKASQAEVDAVEEDVAQLQSDLESLEQEVALKASITSVSALESDLLSVEGYAQDVRSDHDELELRVTDVEEEVALKLNASEVGVSVASLSGGKVPLVQLPGITITDTFVVTNESELTSILCEKGDVAVVTSIPQSFILAGTDPTVAGNWQPLLSPTTDLGGVSSSLEALDGRIDQAELDISSLESQMALKASQADLDAVEDSYLKLDGTKPMQGDLQMAGHSIVSDSLTISAPAGIDLDASGPGTYLEKLDGTLNGGGQVFSPDFYSPGANYEYLTRFDVPAGETWNLATFSVVVRNFLNATSNYQVKIYQQDGTTVVGLSSPVSGSQIPSVDTLIEFPFSITLQPGIYKFAIVGTQSLGATYYRWDGQGFFDGVRHVIAGFDKSEISISGSLVNVNLSKITNLSAGTVDSDAVNKAQLDSAVLAEQTRAISQENALQLAISAEATARAQELEEEADAREAADATLTSNLSQESSRAVAAEEALDTKIDQEIVDRSEAVSAVEARVEALEAQDVEMPLYASEEHELSAEHISDGFVLLAKKYIENAPILALDRLRLFPNRDYAISLDDSGVSKVTFMGTVASGGAEEASEGQFLFVQGPYMQSQQPEGGGGGEEPEYGVLSGSISGSEGSIGNGTQFSSFNTDEMNFSAIFNPEIIWTGYALYENDVEIQTVSPSGDVAQFSNVPVPQMGGMYTYKIRASTPMSYEDSTSLTIEVMVAEPLTVDSSLASGTIVDINSLYEEGEFHVGTIRGGSGNYSVLNTSGSGNFSIGSYDLERGGIKLMFTSVNLTSGAFEDSSYQLSDMLSMESVNGTVRVINADFGIDPGTLSAEIYGSGPVMDGAEFQENGPQQTLLMTGSFPSEFQWVQFELLLNDEVIAPFAAMDNTFTFSPEVPVALGTYVYKVRGAELDGGISVTNTLTIHVVAAV